MMHTARWDHEVDLRGRRVAMIGTGASAVQVIPSIAPEVEHLTVLQRTPIWCLPKPDGAIGPRVRGCSSAFPAPSARRGPQPGLCRAQLPAAGHSTASCPWPTAGERTAIKHLRREVKDPAVREKLTPRYGLGCKRPTFSNEYLPAFNRPNVELETAAIESFTPSRGAHRGGGEHEAEVLILATGFKVFEKGNMPPYPVRGKGGVDLSEWWDENRFQAYEGVSVPGFPNMFMILGPYGFNGSATSA